MALSFEQPTPGLMSLLVHMQKVQVKGTTWEVNTLNSEVHGVNSFLCANVVGVFL